MNNEDLTPPGYDPLVSDAGATITPGAEAPGESPNAGRPPTEAFSRVLKSALERRSPAPGRTESGWGLIPDIAGLTVGRVPSGDVPPTAPATAPGPGGPLLDLNAFRPELGALLAADPARPHEASPAEAETPYPGRVPQGGGVPGDGAGSPAGAVGPRQGGAGTWSAGDRNAAPPVAAGGLLGSAPAWSAGSVAGHPGPTGLISLAASPTGGPASGGSPGGPGQGTSLAPPDRPVSAFALPDVNPVADQLAFTPGSPGAGGVSPYSVDIHESSVGSTAFGPVLSGAVGSGYAVAPGLPSAADEGGGQAPSDAWAGLPARDGGDQANGPAMDFSRTNELLQQLLDEVRRGRQPFLPTNDRNTSL